MLTKSFSIGLTATALLIPITLDAQTCSCGGAPLLSSFGFGHISAGSWQISAAYQYNDISDVVSGSRELTQDSRWQISQSGLVKVGYGISPALAVSGMVSIVQKERSAGDHILVRGPGDAVLLAHLSFVTHGSLGIRRLVISGGLKLPVGRSDMELNGWLLASDLQPTSGAMDEVVSALVSQHFRGLSLTTYLIAAYRITGFGMQETYGNMGYKFGNELLVQTGVDYAPGGRFGFSLGWQYRATSADRFGEYAIPSTGGVWIDILPGTSIAFSRALNVNISGNIPLYRKLEGAIQLTTRYSLTIALTYELERLLLGGYER
jgi:hypothetical protein